MNANHLIWMEESRNLQYQCKVFSVWSTKSRSPEGKKGDFTVIECPDWVIVIPVIERSDGKRFLMVRQWRHGSLELTVEFPGGVLEKGENPESGAIREFQEETAHKAEVFVKLGSFRPNPAIMSNTIHCYLAEKLSPLGSQNLDEDEFVDVLHIKEQELLQGIGKPPFIHSLTASVLALYLLKVNKVS